MRNMISLLALLCAMIGATNGDRAFAQAGTAAALNPVVAWNRTLLTIVRTEGAQPATVHPTRSFAIMHAAIYDAVDAIDHSHEPYLVELSRLPVNASQEAAASVAAHDVLSAVPCLPGHPRLEIECAPGCAAC